jgi:transcriptional regulator with XRE-family HTH domain
MNDFAWYLRAARILQRKSQAEVAFAAGLHLDELQAVEAGRLLPRLSQVIRLAEVLGLEAEHCCRMATAAFHDLPETEARPKPAASAAAGAA